MAGTRKRSRIGSVKNRKKTSWVSDSCFISDLPTNVSHEIFFKLPIKAVMRCKCVCKDWNNTISDPNFSINYAKNSSFTSLFYYVCTNRAKYILNMLEISENGVVRRTPCNPTLPGWSGEKQSVLFVGSCNGFLCVQVHKNRSTQVVYVANPVMGFSIALPECELGLVQFGFSPSINKFKVLRISYDCSVPRIMKKCEIVTVGVDDTWRRLPVTSFALFFHFAESLAFNGAFHWIRKDRTDLITTFDLTDESFGQISAPPGLLPSPEHKRLVVFGDQLGLVDSSALSGISIWKMKKYAVAESWSKVVVLTIRPPLEPGSIQPLTVAELPNGDVLVSCSTGCLLSYSIKHKEWSKIWVYNVQRLSCGYVLNYAPNFSSLSEFIPKGHQNAENVSQSSSHDFSFFQGVYTLLTLGDTAPHNHNISGIVQQLPRSSS